MKNIIVNFSNRNHGNCYNIALYLNNLLTDSFIYNFKDIKFNVCGNCDYECFRKEMKCNCNDSINDIYESIINSKQTIFIIPDYCSFPNSNFFAFNERKCGYINKCQELLDKYLEVPKKFIVISNNFTFKELFSYHVKDVNPKILPLKSKDYSRSSIDGDIIKSNKATKLIKDFIFDNYHYEKSAMAVVFYKDKILVTEEEILGKLVTSLPKGHLEKGEKHIQAAIRECFEETNVKVSNDDFITKMDYFEYNFINHHNALIKKVVYPIVFDLKEVQTPIAKEKPIKNARFISIYEFFKLCPYDVVKDLVLSYEKNR